jgi:UDP-N-acetylmuramoylalanine--D-glutamate ligase
MLKTIITKKIGIFGYGLEGKSLVLYLQKHGARNITVFDERDIELEERVEGPRYICSDFGKNSYDIELAFRSPGVKLDRLIEILGDRIKISSATNLFFELSKGKKIIVTGTKGKSTTVAIVEKVLKSNGFTVYAGGNIGKCPLDFMDELDERCYTIVELSSFQLQDFSGKANYYVFLPILADHLDYHKSFEEYFQAKKEAISSADRESVIILHKDELSDRLVSGFQGKILYYAVSSEFAENGCFQDSLNCKCRDEGRELEIENTLVLSRDKKIPVIDLIASVTLFFKMGLEINLKKILEDFDKPKYRVEFIGNFSGIDFYNDSASTNPISTIEALRLIDKPLVLIAGGSDKGLDYRSLALEATKNSLLKKIFLFGQTAESIKKILEDHKFQGKIICKDKLEDVLRTLSESLTGFGSVLFSPASASFDQFESYKNRGQIFEELVRRYFK